jgi:hypothetical protein
VATEVTQATNCKEQLVPMFGELQGLPEERGRAEMSLADHGSQRPANVEHCEAASIEPLIAPGRCAHHLTQQRGGSAISRPFNLDRD